MLFKIFVGMIGIYVKAIFCLWPQAENFALIQIKPSANFFIFFLSCVYFAEQIDSVHMISKVLKTCRNSLQHLLLNVLRCVCFYVVLCAEM